MFVHHNCTWSPRSGSMYSCNAPSSFLYSKCEDLVAVFPICMTLLLSRITLLFLCPGRFFPSPSSLRVPYHHSFLLQTPLLSFIFQGRMHTFNTLGIVLLKNVRRHARMHLILLFNAQSQIKTTDRLVHNRCWLSILHEHVKYFYELKDLLFYHMRIKSDNFSPFFKIWGKMGLKNVDCPTTNIWPARTCLPLYESNSILLTHAVLHHQSSKGL